MKPADLWRPARLAGFDITNCDLERRTGRPAEVTLLSHTYHVGMKYVTIALDEATLREARRIAAARSTSLGALVREFLQQLTRRESETRRARRRIVQLCRQSKAEVGTRTWTRADLYESGPRT